MAAKKEVSRLVRIARKKQIGIMIESSALNREQLEKLCKICQKCKVDYIYTHTGFGSAGASAEIVQTLVQMLQNKCQVVACGGISSREEAWTMLRAGATQIATSREL